MDKPNNTRRTELLEKCADNLQRGCDPLNHQFLVDNKVTSDECYSLAQQMAIAIKAYVRAPSEDYGVIVIRATHDDEQERERMVAHFRRATARIKSHRAATAPA